MPRTPRARRRSSHASPRTSSARRPMRSRPHVLLRRKEGARAQGDSSAGGSATSSRRRFASSYSTTSGCGTISAGRRSTAESASGATFLARTASPLPLNDLDHRHREDDYDEGGDDRGKHRVAQPESRDQEIGAGHGKQEQDRQDRCGSPPGSESGHRRECKSGVAWPAYAVALTAKLPTRCGSCPSSNFGSGRDP